MASEEEVPLSHRDAADLDPYLDHPMVHDLVNKEDEEENDYSSSGVLLVCQKQIQQGKQGKLHWLQE
jgi:hypothetical protein